MGYNVAIDGPAGAGKSTIAKLVAKEKGYIYVDTGAMYRGLAIHFLDKGIQPQETEKVIEACKDAEVTIAYEDAVQHVYLNGKDISSRLRNEEVGNMASVTSAIPEVRKKLLELQQNLAKTQNVIMDGRDIGTCVLPHADVKVYLTASVETRAKRRYQELQEKGFLTSSCCPAFVKYIKMKFPQLAEHISHNLSPMAETGKLIKEQDPAAKIVFIGPCTAKKGEVRKPEVHQYVDYVMTFEELQAMIDSKDIAVDQLPETELDTATYYGRVFARTGGLSEAVTEAVREQKAAAEAAKADAPDGAGTSGAVASGEAGASGKPANGDGDSADSKPFVFDPIVCDGIDSCKTALLRASKGLLPNNFIEGMVCTDGCIGGAACLSHGNADKRAIDNYGKKASHKEIRDVL